MMKRVCRRCEALVTPTHESQHWDQIKRARREAASWQEVIYRRSQRIFPKEHVTGIKHLYLIGAHCFSLHWC